MKLVKTLLPYVIIILLGFSLRLHRYDTFPSTTENADEIAWTWLGASLLIDGEPTSWSYFSEYQKNELIYQEGPLHAPMVRPAVDHPPLFGFVPGLAVALSGSDWKEIPSFSIIRVPMVFLGTLVIALFGYWTSFFLERRWSLVATLLYATVPLIVFSSRTVVAENMLIILLLLLGIGIQWWESAKKPSHKKYIALFFLVLGPIALLTKIAGITVLAILMAYAFIRKDWKLFSVGVLSTVFGIASLFLYAWSINLELFLAIQQRQASLPIGLSTVFNRFFIKPTLNHSVYYDGWQTLGLFGFVYALMAKDGTKMHVQWLFSLIATVVIIGFIGVTSGEYTFFSWYGYLLLPFLTLFVTLLLQKAFDGKFLLSAVIWILLLPGVDMLFHFTTSQDVLTKTGTRALLFLGFIPFILSVSPVAFVAKLTRYAQVGLFAVLIGVSVLAVLTADTISFELFQVEFWRGIEGNLY